MKKKIGMFMMAACICFGILYPGQKVFAASGVTSLSVSSGNVNIGDSVTVTVKASGASGEKAYATMALSYDSSVLQFVSCSAGTYGGGGNSVTVSGDSFSVTLKAVAAGTSSVSLSASDGVIFDTNEELDSMSGSSASVTVKNAASVPPADNGGGNTTPNPPPAGSNTGGNGGGSTGGNTGGGTGGNAGTEPPAAASGDNSLKSLTISPGTLSPAFALQTTKYSATVANDVTSIAVSATPSNGKASVESVSGNTNLAVGANTVKIVVKAENGVTATYSIRVTRLAAGEETPNQKPDENNGNGDEVTPDEETPAVDETVVVNGASYKIDEKFAAEDIPTDFSETTVNYHGADYKGLSYDKGMLKLLYLAPVDNEAAGKKFFIYDETRDALYPFVTLKNGARYVIALLAPVDFVMPDTYQQTVVQTSVEGDAITAYQKTSGEDTEIVSDFAYFYGMNQDGSESWYCYDALEETYQRCSLEQTVDEGGDEVNMEYLQSEYTALSEKYRKEKVFSRNTFAVLIFLMAVLVVVIINLLLRNRRREDDFMDDGDEEDGRDAEDNLEDILADKDSMDDITIDMDEDDAAAATDKRNTQTVDARPTGKSAEEVERDIENALASRSAQKAGKTDRRPKKQSDDDLEIIDFNDL